MRKKTMFGRRENGLTTFDLMAVVAIIAILVTFATPHLAHWRSLINVNSSARAIASELQKGRMYAINQNTRFRMSFNTEANTYQLQKLVSGTWQNIGDPKTLPNGIDLVSVSADPVFQTLGNTLGSATIVLENTQGHTKSINVSSTGRVKVE
jgi:Tfp pilus assembly protein FimT